MAKKKRVLKAMRPYEIRALRLGLGLSLEQAAEKVGVRPRTWMGWELPSQKRHPSPSHLILIRLMADRVI